MSEDKSFELRCCPDAEPVRCVMYRNHNWDGPDDFTVRAADDNRWLGWGITKEDAAEDAEFTLGDEHAARLRVS